MHESHGAPASHTISTHMLPGQTILITGASSGFGELTARTLAMAGHHVFATMREPAAKNSQAANALRSWAETRGVRLEIVELDVTSTPSVRNAVETILGATGRVDVVVNNAGRGAVGPTEAFTMAQVEDLFNANVYGSIRVNQAVLPSMRRNRSGLIIHITSAVGRLLPGTGGLYPATKFALEALAESFSYEVKPFGIDAVIIEPGAFPSPALSKLMVAEDREISAAYAAAKAVSHAPNQVPSADFRLPDPQEIADAVKRLVDMPAGQRPLRSVVGHLFTEGVAEFNEAYDRAKFRLDESLKRPDQVVTWRKGTAEEASG